MPETLNQGLLNVVAWTIVVAAGVVVCAALFGTIYVVTSPHKNIQATRQLHDTYYTINDLHYPIWPMLLCFLLALVIGGVAYTHTDRHVNRLAWKAISTLP